MKHFKSISQMHLENGWEPPQHPLFSVIGCQSGCPMPDREFTSDCYMIGFKKFRSGVIRYGRTPYDHSNGSLMFVKPSQIIEMRDLELEEKGFMILIHEDYLNGHLLHDVIRQYGFFDYEVNEALHLSPSEETVIWELHDKIRAEYLTNPDEFSREIILSHVDSILKYAQRYYKRQFINRTDMSGTAVTKFNDAIQVYYQNAQLREQGLPSVNGLAAQLSLSPRYLSDLLKQETGKTAMELIHMSLVSEAKNLLKTNKMGVAEIAYQLGFENASYFTRLFKKQTGQNPLEYRKVQLN
ncbi:MAG TPA: helix-turn-helix transcriptional regulator [Dyadobacter sp.]|jgi:AraC-like DNA-binding protein|nr:helix-turn-helix transcriptional regulator [Dyadobacter sp.]